MNSEAAPAYRVEFGYRAKSPANQAELAHQAREFADPEQEPVLQRERKRPARTPDHLLEKGFSLLTSIMEFFKQKI